MSKARKKRDNQVYIKDIAEWKAVVTKPMLLVAEIFAPHFGPCEIMFPFIDELMTNLDNQGQADKVHWAIVNVTKLEEEKAASNAEDALKKQETKVGEKRKQESESAATEEASAPGAATEQELDEQESPVEGSEQLDTTIPYLEKYSGFNHPSPHYAFFRNGIIIDELRGANPPRLEQLVRKWMSSETAIDTIGVSAADASSMVAKVLPIQDPDLEAIPPNERPRRGSMSLYAPDDDDIREPSPERSLTEIAAPATEPSPEHSLTHVPAPTTDPSPPPSSTETSTDREANSLPNAVLASANPNDAMPSANESANSAPSITSQVSQTLDPNTSAAPTSMEPTASGSSVDNVACSNNPSAPVLSQTSEQATVPQPVPETKQADSSSVESVPGALLSAEASYLLKEEPPTIPT